MNNAVQVGGQADDVSRNVPSMIVEHQLSQQSEQQDVRPCKSEMQVVEQLASCKDPNTINEQHAVVNSLVQIKSDEQKASSSSDVVQQAASNRRPTLWCTCRLPMCGLLGAD